MSEYKKTSLRITLFLTIIIFIITLIGGANNIQNIARINANKKIIIATTKKSIKAEENIYPRELEEEINEVNYSELLKPGKFFYQREIILESFLNSEPLKDFQICLKIDTRSLIRQEKMSFDCESIFFTDSDGKTRIPYWLRRDCGCEKTEIWVKIPEIRPFERKKIYFYYKNYPNKGSESNFDEVFTKQNDLEYWYYLDEPESIEILDFSGNKRNGILSKLLFGKNYGAAYKEDGRYFVFFNDWGAEYEKNSCIYLKIPLNDLITSLPSEGSVEMWIRPYEHPSWEESLRKFQKILTDTNRIFELGIFPGGNLYFSPYSDYSEFNKSGSNNLDLADAKIPSGKWTHLIVTWKFKTKEVNFYVDGEKKKKIIENIKNNWYAGDSIGNYLIIGSSDLNIGSNFNGYIDGIRIYSKALDETNVKKAYKYNSRLIRFPKFSFGNEKIISKEGESSEIIDLSKIEQLRREPKISINLQYATPLDVSDWGWSSYPHGEKDAYLIHKNEQDYIPIFGVPSHFFSYEGTKTYFADSYILYYIGLRIKNPKLIKDLKIEFKKIESYFDTYYDVGLLKKLLPSAYACGPGYDYVIVGESELELISKSKDLYWYKLKNPIFVNKETKMMQIYYKPTGKQGFLTLKIEEMIFLDKERKYLRPTYWQYTSEEKYHYGTYHPVTEYRAWFTVEEKGFITFKQNPHTLMVEIVFENNGSDQITIDNQSINYIETQLLKWRILKLLVRDVEGKIFFTISMNTIKEKIINKTINPGKTLSIPFFLPSSKLKKDRYYYITAQVGEKTEVSNYNSERKIINWILGDDEYHYFDKLFWGTQDILICSFYSSSNGFISPINYQ